jgi:lipopolysaccharide transport system permease protein
MEVSIASGNDTVITYLPDNSLKKGYSRIFREIYDEVKKNRYLIYQLFKRDFLTNYRQSFFGILWAFIVPIVSVSAFVLLNQSGLFNFGSVSVPYPVFALFGLAFWQLFSTGIVASSSSLVQAGSMIAKINFSKKALVIASMGKTFVAFIIQLVLALVVFVYYWAVQGVVPNLAILLIPVFIVPVILLTLGLGFILSVLNGVIRDFGNLLSILMTFLLFLTPVMYVAPTGGILAEVTRNNPLYYLVSVPRDLALTGVTSEWFGFLVSSVLSLVVFVVCLVAFHLTETRIAERI